MQLSNAKLYLLFIVIILLHKTGLFLRSDCNICSYETATPLQRSTHFRAQQKYFNSWLNALFYKQMSELVHKLILLITTQGPVEECHGTTTHRSTCGIRSEAATETKLFSILQNCCNKCLGNIMAKCNFIMIIFYLYQFPTLLKH